MLNRGSLLLCLVGGLAVAASADDADAQAQPRHRYAVDILELTADDELKHLCTGAIVDNNHLLTTANCLGDLKLQQLRVRSGSDKGPPSGQPHREERLFHRVVKAMTPAAYVALPCRAHEHDLAVLKVDRQFDLAYERLYRQINLPEASNDYDGYLAYVAGHAGEAKVISNEECARNASAIVTRGNVCANVADDLQWTGSAPLVHENTLVGFMNAPSKCGEVQGNFKCYEQPRSLKIFTRITSYLGFIGHVLNNQPSADIVYRS